MEVAYIFQNTTNLTPYNPKKSIGSAIPAILNQKFS